MITVKIVKLLEMVLPDESKLLDVELSFVDGETVVGTKKVGLNLPLVRGEELANLEAKAVEDGLDEEAFAAMIVEAGEKKIVEAAKNELQGFVRDQELVAREKIKAVENGQLNSVVSKLQGVIIE